MSCFAKGILIAQRRCLPDEAFEILVSLSQRTHQKLRDVAAALVTQTLTS
jgi:AmiR/NasT family two-component response regulator